MQPKRPERTETRHFQTSSRLLYKRLGPPAELRCRVDAALWRSLLQGPDPAARPPADLRCPELHR